MTLASGWLGAYDGWDIFVVIGISLRWLEGIGWGDLRGVKDGCGEDVIFAKIAVSNWLKMGISQR